MKNLLIVLLIFSFSALANNEERLNQIESRLDDIEINQALSKLSFSGSFFNHVESYQELNNSTDLLENAAYAALRGDSTDEYLTPILMRVELNFDVNISQNLNFYSTLGMSKFWNQSARTGRSVGENDNFNSLAGGYDMTDSRAKFDVAYVQYHKQDSPWTIAMGRMTTNNGPPQNQLDGVGRSGTYPFLTYNVIFDGAAAIYNYRLQNGSNLVQRLFYTPFLKVDPDSKSSQVTDSSGSSTDNNTGESGEKVDSNGSLVTLLTEFSKKDFAGARKFNLYHSIYNFEGFYDRSRQKLQTSTATCGALAGSDQYDEFCRDGVEYAATTANTIYIGFDGIMGSNINFSYTYNKFSVRNSGDDEIDGFNTLATLNYRFDNSFNGGHILGVEYIFADENHVPVDSTTMFVNRFYNLINGEGFHTYYNMVLSSSQLLRIGYLQYTEGESFLLKNDIESKATASYLRWKVFF